MSATRFDIEAYRPDVDALDEKLMAVIRAETRGLPLIDRDIIVAGAIANVACRVDGRLFKPGGVTDRLSCIADMWRGRS